MAEDEVEGDCTDVRNAVDGMESAMDLTVGQRLMDPNMGRTPSGQRREITWQDEFDEAGLTCDLADDSAVGRKRINQYLKPDKMTRQPRLHAHTRCRMVAQQMKRYVWDEYRASLEKDIKQKPREKNDDYPTLLKYLLNSDPTFGLLHQGAPVISRGGSRKGAYG